MTPTRTRHPAIQVRRHSGFTLLELLIAVAVIGILAAIAYPSYTNYVQKARVTDGKAKLMEVAGQLERCYTVTNDYAKQGDGTACVNFTGLTSDEGYYAISAFAKDGSEFSSPAADFKLEASGSAGEVACTKLWINSEGQQGSTPSECW